MAASILAAGSTFTSVSGNHYNINFIPDSRPPPYPATRYYFTHCTIDDFLLDDRKDGAHYHFVDCAIAGSLRVVQINLQVYPRPNKALVL
jgi:hypothetical protein